MLNELKRKKRGQQLNRACRCCHMKNHFSKNRFARMLEMISYFLSGAVVVFYLNNGFLTGFTGPSILSTSVNTHNKENKENPQICIYRFSTIAAEETLDHWTQACLCLQTEGVFPSTSHSGAGGPWITLSMFSLSALFERGVLYLASKACHRLPAVCHFRQRERRLPHLLQQPRDLGHMFKLHWRRNVVQRHRVCPCPAESLSVKLALLNVGALASDGRSHLEHLDEHGALNLQ